MLDLPEHILEDEPIFTARDLLVQRWGRKGVPNVLPPRTVIVCYQRPAIAALLKRYPHTKVSGFFGDLQLLKTRGQPVGVLQPFGPGAPIAAAVLEELSAFGARRFVSLGLAGSLSSDLHAGDVVIADRALRDEGTSYHYLPPARSVEANPEWVQHISVALSARHIVHSISASWTTDAPYRETRRQVEARRAEGVKTVEMEAAAVFAVGQHLGVTTAAVFVIGDRLADLVWQPASDPRMLERSLKAVAEAIVIALCEE
jgi:uridine phosphorylase